MMPNREYAIIFDLGLWWVTVDGVKRAGFVAGGEAQAYLDLQRSALDFGFMVRQAKAIEGVRDEVAARL